MAIAQYDLTPTRIDLTLVRGDTWKLQFKFPVDDDNPSGPGIDLSGSTWLAQIRETTQDGTLFATWDVDDTNQANGMLIISIDESITETATVGHKLYWYDVQQTLSGDVATPVMGMVSIVADTSKV